MKTETPSVKLTTVGNSTGIVLPKEILEMLKVDKGDRLFVTQSPGGIVLTPYDAALDRQLGLAERVMREDRDVLKKLAE